MLTYPTQLNLVSAILKGDAQLPSAHSSPMLDQTPAENQH